MFQAGVVLTLIFGVAVSAGPFPEQHSDAAVSLFKQWQLQYNKVYHDDKELWHRYHVFIENLKFINALNATPKQSSSDPVRFGLNQFADMTIDEFRRQILQPPRPPMKYKKFQKLNRTVAAPAAFDWTEKEGVVTSIKDQGQAGTCWAFAGCANVESLWGLKKGELSPDLSTQALNDCDGIVDLQTQALACGPLGATMPGFYEFVIKEGGLMTWEDYPYCVGTGACSPCAPDGYSAELCGGPWPISPCSESDSCAAKYDKSKFVPGLSLTDYRSFSSDEDQLLDDLVNVAPLVAGIDATDLQFYQGGILEPVMCNEASLNHAVLMVGYDEASDGTKFWRVKNSWGTQWGENGFGRIIRGTGACGVNSDVSSAVLG